MTKEDKDDLAEEIAKKVFALKEEKEKREKQESTKKMYGRKAAIF